MSENILIAGIKKKASLPKEVFIGWLTSLTEAYNTAIFSFLAPMLALFFFQNENSFTSLFFSYSFVFLGSSLFYPMGAFYYGTMGDAKGRQKTCVYSTLGLAISTGLIAFIPEGAYGAFFLLILICAQHFFSGGEYYGSIVFSIEHADKEKSGILSALSCLFASFGLALANGLAYFPLLKGNELWMKSCFIIGALGGMVSYLLKNYCQETPAFKSLPLLAGNETKVFEFIKKRSKSLLKVVIVSALFIISYNFIFIFLPLHQNGSETGDSFKPLIFYGFSILFAGFLADRFGLNRVLMSGILLFSLAVTPICFFKMDLWVRQIILTSFASLIIGPIHSFMMNQFEPKERCRGLFIGSAIAMSLFGGSTVPICLLLFFKFNSLAAASLYPMAIGTASFIYLYQEIEDCGVKSVKIPAKSA